MSRTRCRSRRPMRRAGIVLFALSAAACASAQTLPATVPASAGPGLPAAAFSSIGPGMNFLHAPVPDPADEKEVAADQDAVASLTRTLGNVRLLNTSLEDAFAYIRDMTDLTINVNWPALNAAGVARDAVININVKTISVGGVLDTILADAQNGRQVVDYEIQRGALTIDTVENLDKIVVTRSYDLSPLLPATPAVDQPAPAVDQPAAATAPSTAPADNSARHAALDAIVARVRQSVEGSPALSLRDASLQVTANLRTQRAVADCLEKLHGSNPSP